MNNVWETQANLRLSPGQPGYIPKDLHAKEIC